MRKGLVFLFFGLLAAKMSFASLPDSSSDYLLIGEIEARSGQLLSFFSLQKTLTVSEQLTRLYGGDLARGCPLDSITVIIIGGSPSHDNECERAAKSIYSKVRVAFFPWDIPAAKEVAEYLEVALVMPVSSSETIGYGYAPQDHSRDVMLFVSLAFWNASDWQKTYYARPENLSKYSVCTTVADSTGKIIGPVGPNVDFAGYWPTNYRSFIICQTYSSFEYVRERADNMGISLTFSDTRSICYMLASEGSIDSLGRRESFRGVIDVSNPAKVDSAIFAFETQKRFAAVSASTISPNKFSLAQNYPNPFNPTTTIQYELGSATHVHLTIFNSLGQEIEKVVNEFQAPGSHQVVWNAGDAPSGVYYYHLVGEGFSEVRRMTLLK